MPLLDKMAARINVGKIPDFKNMSVRTKHNVLRTSAAIGIGLAAAIALILITASEPGEAVHYFLMAPSEQGVLFSPDRDNNPASVYGQRSVHHVLGEPV